MTSFEHAMLGANGALALGLHRRAGFQIVALAAAAAVLPDWDGATILFSRNAFVDGHRVWGHNLVACLLLGVVVGWLDYRFDLVTRVSRLVCSWTHAKVEPQLLVLRKEFKFQGVVAWVLVAIVATSSHLLGDLLVSGTKTLPDWHVQLLWPFSSRGWVFPMVRWGDAGMTIVFVAGMFAMLKWRSRTQVIAVVTLVALAAYMIIRRQMI